MKKTFYALLALVLVIFTSCSNEEIVKHRLPSSEGQLVTFSLGIPGRVPVTYAPQLHELDEYNIARLDIFQFDANGFVKAYSGVGTTSAPVGNKLAMKTVTQIRLPHGTKGAQDFLFVANNDPSNNKMLKDLASTTVGTSKSVFKEELTKKLSLTGAKLVSPFLMTGEKSATVTGGALDLTGDVVLLTRVVARIDVGIRLSSSGNGEVLTISSVELKDAPRDSYLFKKGSGESPVNSGTSDNSSYSIISTSSSPNLQSYFENKPTTEYDSRYKKLFYLYERSQSEFGTKGAPALLIKGKYRKDSSSPEVAVSYVANFTKDIKRNHIYKVILGVKPNGSGNNYTAALSGRIKTLKWEEEELIPTTPFSLFTFTPSNSGFTYDSSNRTMTLTSGVANTFTDAFTVESRYANDNASLEVVKTNATVPNPNNDWISAVATAGKLTIRVEANNEGKERAGIIWFKSSKDTNSEQLYGIKIVQPKQ